MRPARNVPFLGRALDRFARIVSPKWGAVRHAWRLQAEAIEKLYRAGTRSRLDPKEDSSSGNELLEAHRASMVKRARQLERDNFIADGILSRIVENVNGPEGFRLRPNTGDADLDKKLAARWARWDAKEADIRGLVPFSSGDGLMSHVLRSGVRDGDCLLVKHDSGHVSIVEADRIDTPSGKQAETDITDGVRVDPATGRVLEFFVEAEDAAPGDELQTVAAEDAEFFARRPRHSYVRGVSLFSKPWVYEQLNAFLEALVVNQRIAACFGVLVKSPTGAVPPPGLSNTENAAGDSQAGFNLEPGMVKYLRKGEEVEQLDPKQPSTMLGEFMAIMGRIAGLPAGLPLEIAFLDFSHTNYSSARAALLQAQRAFMLVQSALRRIYSAVYEWQVARWVEAGDFEESDALLVHTFEAPGWEWVDPLKEAQAHGLSVALGFESVGQVTRGRGRDAAEVLAERMVEEQARRDAKVPGFHLTGVKPLAESGAEGGDDG